MPLSESNNTIIVYKVRLEILKKSQKKKKQLRKDMLSQYKQASRMHTTFSFHTKYWITAKIEHRTTVIQIKQPQLDTPVC